MNNGHLREHIDLLEAHTYASLLTEAARGEFLFKTYGERLKARWEAEGANEDPGVQQAVNAEQSEDFGGKVLAYIMRHDPSRTQGFSQWMVNKYLKGGFRLEDAPRVMQYLDVFDKAKSRIAKKDINAYKDTAELYQAVRPFIEDNVAVSGKQEQDLEAQKFAQPNQSQLILDDSEMKIVIPKTREAAIYFGRNTEWCTAATSSTNYFDSYNNRGPLYVILLKAENRRYQWHFESGQFMDEHDARMRNPTMAEFCQQHPKVIKAIGEDKFMGLINEIGLQYFSEEARRKMSAQQMVPTIKNKESWLAVPAEVRETPEFIQTLIIYDIQNSRGRSEVFKWLPPKTYVDILPEIVAEEPMVLASLPPRFQTQNLAHVALAKATNYHRIDNWIPKKLWDEQVTDQYWEMRIAAAGHQGGNIQVKDVPEKYRTEENLRRLLVQNNDAYAKEAFEFMLDKGWVDQELANKLVDYDYRKITYMPPQFYSKEMANVLWGRIARLKQYEAPAKELLYLTKFPHELLTDDMIHWLVDKHHLTDYTQVPSKFHTDNKMMAKLLKNKKGHEINKVPRDLLTHELINDIIGTDNVKSIDPDLISNAHLEKLIKGHSYWKDNIWKDLPKVLKKRPGVVDMFVNEAAVPVKDIPKQLLTPRTAIARVKGHHDEYAQLPPIYRANDKFNVLTVKHIGWSMVQHFDDKVLTKRVFDTFMEGIKSGSHYSYGRDDKDKGSQFHRFDKSLWDSASVFQAMQNHFIAPEFKSVPEGLLNKEITALILARTPDEIAKAPADMIDDKSLGAAVESNADLLSKLRPEQMTEEVCYMALKGNARHNWRADRLNVLPRENFSYRCWMEAVGNICTLKEVPAKFRKPELVREAIIRDAENLKVLKDPAGYFLKHKMTFPLGYGRLRDDLENAGIFITKVKGQLELSNATDLNPLPLPSGLTYGIGMVGSKNRIAYLFDKKGKPAVRAKSDKGKVTIETKENLAKPFRASIKEMLNAAFTEFETSMSIQNLGIFYEKGSDDPWFLAEDGDRKEVKGLTWSNFDGADGGSVRTLWIKNKPALRITYGTSNAMYGRGTYQMTDVNVIDVDACVPVAAKIYDYIHEKSSWSGSNTAYPGGWQLSKIGINAKSRNDGYRLVTRKKIAEVDGLSIYAGDDNHLAIFGKKRGLLASAIVRKNGTIDKIDIRNRYGEGETEEQAEALNQKLYDAFNRIQGTLLAKSDKKK